MKKLRTGVVIVAVLAVGVGAGWWAARAFTAPYVAAPPEIQTSDYQVELGSVGKTMPQIAQASWDTTMIARSRAQGTITALAPLDTPITAGDELLTVGLRPVIAAEGSIPSFRDLEAGDTGADVKQLQTALGISPSGTVDAATEAAVKDWQKAHGFPVDGIVQAQDIVYVPELPARLTFADGVSVGVELGPGMDLLALVAAEPTIILELTPDQMGPVPTDANVTVSGGEFGAWEGAMGPVREVPPGVLHVPLVAPDGGAICGSSCIEAIPLGEPTMFAMTIEVIPETTGPLIPTSAIKTDAGPDTTVELTDRTRRTVTIIASSNGLAVVDGVEPGERIAMPAAP